MTQGERIATLEANEGNTRDALGAIMTQLSNLEKHIDERFDKIDTRLTAQEAKLAAYENKGKGFLFAAGLFGASAGASILAIIQSIIGTFR